MRSRAPYGSSLPVLRSITRWVRIVRLLGHVMRGLFIAAFFFPFESDARRKDEIRRWSAQLLAILAIRVEAHGAPERSRPLMLVANHVSWLDIFVIDSVLPVRFVAKSEVRRWPFVGWLSARCGTIFIERTRRHDTIRINEIVGASLVRGEVFAVFPEGTTTDGSTLLKFHASLLEPAVASSATLQPVAIRFERADGSLCTEAAFDGVRSVWDVLMGVTANAFVRAHVWFLPALRMDAAHRREVAARAREEISSTLFPEAQRSRTAQSCDLRAAAP